MKATAPAGSTWALSLPLTEMVADYLELDAAEEALAIPLAGTGRKPTELTGSARSGSHGQ